MAPQGDQVTQPQCQPSPLFAVHCWSTVDGQLVIVVPCCFTDVRIAADGRLSVTIANVIEISSDEMETDEEQNGWTSGTSRGDSRLIVFKPVHPKSEGAWQVERCDPLPEVASTSAVFQTVAQPLTDLAFLLVRLPVDDFSDLEEVAGHMHYSFWPVHVIRIDE
jgi:hypothetical protein